jgi:outer membrane protein assembly factor BamB
MFDPRERSQPITFLACLFVACLLLCGLASAAPSITLSKKSGPPTSKILVSGRGFEPNVGVDIFFDTKDKALVVTNGKGAFHDAGIFAPRSARPGEHWVTALERNNDKGAQEPFLVQTDWSEFRFAPDHKGLNPYENVLNRQTVAGMGLKWSHNTTYSVWGSPTVTDGVAYVATSPYLYALDTETGAVRRTYDFCCEDLLSSDPAVANGIIYVGLFDTGLHALDAKTGTRLWNYPPVARVICSPAVANGMVYFNNSEDDSGDSVFAVDARTGKLIWSSVVESSFSSPAVADGIVYVGSDDLNVYALDAFTGVKLWSYTTGDVVRSSPAVANGVVYVGSFDHNVYALNATTGAKLWSYATGDWVWSSPAVANGVVYVGSYDHNIYALDAFTGAKIWSSATGNDIYSSPAVANGVVYVGSLDGNLYALNAVTGEKLWSYVTGDRVWSSPTVVNGVVYAGSDDGNIYAFRPTAEAKVNAEKRRVSKRPDLSTFRPDFSLKVSQPGTT